MVIKFSLYFLRNGNHVLEEDLESHTMAAAFVGDEEFTVAVEGAVIETDIMIVIVAMEGDIEFIEPEAFAVFRITLGFFELADQS